MTTEAATPKPPEKPPEKPEEKPSIWSSSEKQLSKEKYGCEIIIDSGSLEDVSIKKAPTDAYIIKYLHEDKVRFDLTRGTKVTIFDMYWDKFKDGLKSINYGNGSIKPNLWGYQAPPSKKKRKS